MAQEFCEVLNGWKFGEKVERDFQGVNVFFKSNSLGYLKYVFISTPKIGEMMPNLII